MMTPGNQQPPLARACRPAFASRNFFAAICSEIGLLVTLIPSALIDWGDVAFDVIASETGSSDMGCPWEGFDVCPERDFLAGVPWRDMTGSRRGFNYFGGVWKGGCGDLIPVAFGVLWVSSGSQNWRLRKLSPQFLQMWRRRF